MAIIIPADVCWRKLIFFTSVTFPLRLCTVSRLLLFFSFPSFPLPSRCFPPFAHSGSAAATEVAKGVVPSTVLFFSLSLDAWFLPPFDLVWWQGFSVFTASLSRCYKCFSFSFSASPSTATALSVFEELAYYTLSWQCSFVLLQFAARCGNSYTRLPLIHKYLSLTCYKYLTFPSGLTR